MDRLIGLDSFIFHLVSAARVDCGTPAFRGRADPAIERADVGIETLLFLMYLVVDRAGIGIN